MDTELRGISTTRSISVPNPNLLGTVLLAQRTSSSSLSAAGALQLQGCLGNLDGACIEKLLLHCAGALETKDVTLAQQVMWVLNNVASSTGDPNQRLTSYFLRALICRASRVCFTTAMKFHGSRGTTTYSNLLQQTRTKPMAVTELADYVDLIPWHRFGFCASNSSILKAIQGFSKVHILDFSITHCMQWPTLIDALAKRLHGPPSLRITVPSSRPPVPPLLNVPSKEVGLRLANFAQSRDVPFEFHVINCGSSSKSSDIDADDEFHIEVLLSQLSTPSLLDLRDDEALVINCQNWLRFLPDVHEPRKGADDHQEPRPSSLRDRFLDIVHNLNPQILIIVDEDADLDAPTLKSRITSCFNYLWIPFDALETFLPKDSTRRNEYEADIGHKIENIIGFEGMQRIERLESGTRLVKRMKDKGNFVGVPFVEETVKEVKCLLDERASGWGMKRDEDMLVLTWKGHNSVFASAWVPYGSQDLRVSSMAF